MADDCTVVRFSNESHSARIETLKASDNNDKLCETVPEFGLFYVICICVSILTYTIDYILPCWLLYYYHSVSGNGVYFALTLTFVVFPAILMTGVSMRWYIVDDDDPALGKPSLRKWILRIILLLLQLTPLLRYCDALSYGLRSRAAGCCGNRQRQSKLYRRMLDEDSNGALLRLFHCFLHAAPQALIQLMILLQYLSRTEKLTPIELDLTVLEMWTTLCGLVSIAWSLTSYHRSVRYARDDKEKLSYSGTVILFCWQLMSAVSRILALALLASLRPAWMGSVCLIHWAIMGAWLALGQAQTAVCASRCEEVLLSIALGLAYVVAFVAPRDGPTRYSYLAYYLVCFMENIGALVVWCVTYNSSNNAVLYYGAVTIQMLTFILTLVFMSMYYRCFHPSAHIIHKCVVDLTEPSTSHLDKPSYSKTYTHS